MGEEVRGTTANACTSLARRVVMTAPMETAIEDARHASDLLAKELDRRDAKPVHQRVEAMAALEALVAW
jgi:hypothetical protein